jgi:N-acetylmuramoyl-L-alanine amidase-like protein
VTVSPELARLLRPCKVRRARHDSGPRSAGTIRHVVLHSTEGGTASSVATYFATSARASTQLVVDDRECYRCVPDLVIPWGAPGVNRTGLHVEHCGFARWSREEWLAHDATLRRSAAKVARWCLRYGIPRRLLTVDELRAGQAGICTHRQASIAFPPNDGHVDPGDGFPRAHYLALVRRFYRELAATRAVP